MKAFLPLLITLLIQAFSALAMMAVPVLVPVVPGPPPLTTAGIGVYVLFAYVGAIVGSLSAGPLVDRWGAIRVSQCALLLSAAGLCLAALFPATLIPAAVLVGLGYGPITPASSHVLIRTTPPQRRNLVFSIKQTGVPVGVALSGFCIPPLGAATGWASTLGVLALACVATTGAAQPVRHALDEPSSSARSGQGWSVARLLGDFLEPMAVILRHPGLRTLAAVSFILSGIQISFSSYLVSFLTSELAMTALLAGSLLGLSQSGGVIGRIAWGYLSDRWGRPLMTLATICVLLALASLVTGALALAHFALPGLLLAALMIGFGASASGWNGVYLAEVARQAPPGAAGRATSGTLAFTFLGVIIGTPLFGLIASGVGGFAFAFGMQAVLAVGLSVILVRLDGRHRAGLQR